MHHPNTPKRATSSNHLSFFTNPEDAGLPDSEGHLPAISGGSSLSAFPYYEITFLNRIARVFLAPEFPPSSPQTSSDFASDKARYQNFGTASSSVAAEKSRKITGLKELLVNHFDIHTHLLEQVLLVDVETNTILWEDSELVDYSSYFLAFTRLGSRIPNPENVEAFLKELPCDTSLLAKPLFARRGREDLLLQASSSYPLSRIDDLELQKRRGNPFGLVCPLLDCSRDFKRSGDLTVHFSVETGFKPFQCKQCGASFRRRILLAHHAFYHDCSRRPVPPQRKRKALADKLAPEAFDMLPGVTFQGNVHAPLGESPTLGSPDSLIRFGINSLYSGVSNQPHSLEAGSPQSGDYPPARNSSAKLIQPMNRVAPSQPADQIKSEHPPPEAVRGHSVLFLQLRQIIKNRLSFEFLQKKLETAGDESRELLVARLLMCQQLADTSKLLQTRMQKVE